MKFQKVFAAMAVILSVLTFSATAIAKDEIYTGRFSKEAVDGYDPVAYFTEGRPVEGSDEFTYDHKGAEWKFSSQENLDLFKADSTAYAPQYGGYCAWAMAKGKFASANPHNWTILDGKLYLNYSDSVQRKWEKDITGFIEQADARWPAILN